ncbi:hypothetical protein [Ornithinimicrobium kibberense]
MKCLDNCVGEGPNDGEARVSASAPSKETSTVSAGSRATASRPKPFR